MSTQINFGATAQATDLKSEPSDFGFDTMQAELRATFASGKTKKLCWRKKQLKQIIRLIEENHELIAEAVVKDHGGSKVRALFEFAAHKEANLALDNLEKWANPQLVPNDTFLGTSKIHRVPKGLILLLSPWNFPFELTFSPLVSAIAAGNCIVIKPSEIASHSAVLIEELLLKYLDNSAVRIVQGAVPETTALLKMKWDHIFYTGNGMVGRVVARAAAENLTPLTLELGGKSPMIVDDTAKLDTVVERFVSTKYINVGQVCISPDFIVVHEKVASAFKKKLIARIKAVFHKAQQCKDYGRLVNERHVKRVQRLLESTSGKIILGGHVDPSDRFIEPTLIESPSIDDPILNEEIFGPVTPIVTMKDLNEGIQIANHVCNEPLVLYIFSESQKNIDHILNNTISGGVCINSIIEQNANLNVPFGGFGESGMGSYHGKHGFDELTHARTIVQKDTTFTKGWAIPPPPYPDAMYDIAMKYQYTGFLTQTQKNILKLAGAAAASYLILRPKL